MSCLRESETAETPQEMIGLCPIICDEASEAMQEHKVFAAAEEAWRLARGKRSWFAEYRRYSKGNFFYIFLNMLTALIKSGFCFGATALCIGRSIYFFRYRLRLGKL
ncbi:hypothetical protein AC739_00845 [Planococcus glaciei]|nr:hypothetical protein AC739_00845 [Planococcus glaciei]